VAHMAAAGGPLVALGGAGPVPGQGGHHRADLLVTGGQQ
jgi:hypothetical protein